MEVDRGVFKAETRQSSGGTRGMPVTATTPCISLIQVYEQPAADSNGDY
jgi:hypothetical protein